MNNNEIYSNFTKLHKGNRAIDRLNGNIDRWGDYSGIQRKYDDPCRTWISGMFGKIGSNGSWISSISTSDTCREPLPYLFLEPAYNQGVLFPNPSKDFVNYDFTLEENLDLKISIFSIEGKLVTVLYNDLVNSGPNRLSFDITKLRVGSYLLIIENNENRLFTKKLIKN
jgi:hypothetical protein